MVTAAAPGLAPIDDLVGGGAAWDHLALVEGPEPPTRTLCGEAIADGEAVGLAAAERVCPDCLRAARAMGFRVR